MKTKWRAAEKDTELWEIDDALTTKTVAAWLNRERLLDRARRLRMDGMEFKWDSTKAARNLQKHGVSYILDSCEHADSMMIVMMRFRKHPGERKRWLTAAEARNE